MEVLSPPSFRKPEDLTSGDRYRIAPIDREGLPWENGGEKSRPNQKLYYQIILGSVDMESAVATLIQIYTDSRAERPQARGEAVLATIMVDRDGRPVEADPVAISSFGWGVPIALGGCLSDLGQWPSIEKRLLEELGRKIIQHDKEGEPLPLTLHTIRGAYEWLVRTIGIESKFVKPPVFAVRSYQYFKLQDPPEAILLNSFFLDDLASAQRLVGSGGLTSNLKRYLGKVKPRSRRNLMKDDEALADALEPGKFPLGSWPGEGRHPLVTLQQCAVNLALHDLKTDGILAVNGPPGTGKTTLLRDVVVALMTQRAEVLCSYDDPEDAFIHSGQKLKKGNAFVHLYRVAEKARGYEIVVASSNNKAVENVSAELPGLKAVADDARDLRYFKTVSDALLQKESWGAIAAVLGNSKNRADFRQTFWWDNDTGLQRYLHQACGNPQLLVEKTEDGTRQRPPRVVVQENAPENHDDALRRWKRARQRFRKTLSETKVVLAELQEVRDLLRGIPQRRQEIADLDSSLAAIHLNIEKQMRLTQDASILHADRQKIVEAVEREQAASLHSHPGFWSRLFQTAAHRRWDVSHQQIAKRLSAERDSLATAAKAATDTEAAYQRARSDIQHLEDAKSSSALKLQQEEAKYRALVERHSGIFVSEDFFELGHKEKQKAAPWLDEKTARLRNDLFEAAMALHKAFIDAAAKPIRHNLNTLLDGFGTRSLGSPEKDALTPHLWSTLFLVVPVVSTTFASVSRMFGRIGADAFGWLLIDEAGQALPQAAVGALMRTKRAVVVGDPIQIEPVVVLPDQLTEAMCQQFGIDPLIYNAPGASAQTLADSATEYFGTFETKFGTREVGVPLLVHRRCTEPMFGISNSIAYENLMVHAKAPRGSPIRDVLGASRWINVEGHGQDKWCAEEGRVLLDLLRKLREEGCAPDFYIVTPFVAVQDGIRQALRTSGLLDGWVENPHAWVFERVGTVHTVQGREAEAVFFVLGAPMAEQRGARGWAGGRPNLLNVAVTRSKEALYVIGNRRLWKTAGVFQTLDNFLA